ncbi:MAG: UDP-N-acetylmuramoyl-L-alanine--D-glutamate ligase [Betaproteobacteria bacterium]|nr:MAG: UDP-N-acetylmuramoyl-L-alanine--D-glutamate ligase [Betaproteobacteria bacterium]
MTPLALTGLKTLVVGLGDTGASCVRWLQAQGAIVRGTDTRTAPPHTAGLAADQMTLGGFDAADFAWADLIVVSPGVSVATREIAAAAQAGKPIVGDIELFAQAIAGDGSQAIAITGSNGKSTVTSLVAHLCTAAGKRTVMAGNIGLPVLDALMTGERPEVWVLELSSFQLETTHSLKLAAATVLNLSEDHLDRYDGMGAYVAAKARIYEQATVQVVNRDDAAAFALADTARPLRSFGLRAHDEDYGVRTQAGVAWLAEGLTALCPVSDVPLAGLHNAANALAALALCRAIALPYAALLPALQTFKGLPHRVEKVAEDNGVTYYDDSKGTNVGATCAALRGFTQPVILIAGGDGKGQDFAPLREAAHHARVVLLIGRDARLIEAALGPRVTVQQCATLENAVAAAHALAQPGDCVLLSPACASLDQFRNYVHRAEVFKAEVMKQLGGAHVS